MLRGRVRGGRLLNTGPLFSVLDNLYDMCYNEHMSVYTVRKLNPFIQDLIREYAVSCHVSQAEVITWAVANLEDAFKREGYPPGWRIPRWDRRSPQEPARAKQTTARRVRAR
jgi:hypothetical protein